MNQQLDPTTLLTAIQTRHLLRRTLFGLTKFELDNYTQKTLEQIIQELFSISANPDPPVVNYTNGKDITEPLAKDGETWINEPWNNDIEYLRLLSLKTWWLDQQMQSKNLIDKMIFFWHNHIPVEMVGVFHARQGYDYYTTLRKNALGNFRTLIKELTINPLMLFYLNGNVNNKFAPDENYARELQELFCIGKGPNAKFTEDDVRAAARVLTGWRTDYLKPKTYFDARNHDENDKKFSSFYNNHVIKFQPGLNGGEKELDELLDMIVGHPESALFICRKLYRFFVYPEIDDETEKNFIPILAKIFSDSNFEIAPVLLYLFTSTHFYSDKVIAAVIKSPLDFTLGFNKHFNMNFPSNNESYKGRFEAQKLMYYFLTSFQMDIGDPPNVSGWPAYYQQPNYDKSWISTHTIVQRAIHTDMLVYYGYQMFDKVARIDWIDYTNTYADASDPNKLIDQVISTVFDVPIDTTHKSRLKTILLSGQIADYYWTDAWNNWKREPQNAMARQTVENRLKPFYQYLLQLEEYQLN